MEAKKFRLEIITPRRTVYAADVTSFSAPGVVGGFQVLQSHAPLMSSLEIGELKVVEPDGTEYHYATSGGFVEVRDNVVVVLADTAERADEIDAARAQTSRDRAQARISERTATTDLDRAKLSLTRAMNRLKVASR